MSILGKPANAEMVQGYLDGYGDDRPEFPASLSNRGASYRHGWLNGRDDRVKKPRASDIGLDAEADIAMSLDEAWQASIDAALSATTT